MPSLTAYNDLRLSFSYPEHFSAAGRAGPLGSRFPVFHLYLFRVLYFHLFTALHAVCLHRSPPIICTKDRAFSRLMSIMNPMHI